MDNTLLLHIGTMKTGSTSLQKFLYDNAKRLEEYGWKYPYVNYELEEVGEQFINIDFQNGSVFNASWIVRAEELAQANKQDWNETWDIENRFDVDTRSKQWEKTWEIIRKHLEENNVIVSEELISWRNTYSFLKAAKEQYNNIKVIIYLRRQDRFWESTWNQFVKCSLVSRELDAKSLNLEKGDYYTLLNNISTIIGKDNLIVRVYEKEQLIGNDIILDFLDVLQIPGEIYDKTKITNENASLVGHTLEIKRVFNKYIEEEIFYGENLQPFFSERTEAINVKQVDGYLTKEERAWMLDYYAESNRKVAMEYLGRNLGELFGNNDLNKEKNIQELDPVYSDIIRIFTNIVNDIYKKKNEVHSQLVFMTNNLLLLKCGDRKLCLWGAGRMCKDILRKYSLPVDYVIDNNKCQEDIEGIKVISPDEVEEWKDYFIIISCCYECEISKQLNRYGLKKNQDFVWAKDYFWR